MGCFKKDLSVCREPRKVVSGHKVLLIQGIIEIDVTIIKYCMCNVRHNDIYTPDRPWLRSETQDRLGSNEGLRGKRKSRYRMMDKKRLAIN